MSTSSVVQFSKPVEAGELASMIRMLPPLPEVAHKILTQFDDEFLSAKSIAEIVECDPAISGRLFALANSAYFGLSKPVTEMHVVVSRVLGPDTVRSLAFALATEQTFDIGQCTHFDSRRFWQRSLYCASSAQRVAKVVEDIDAEVKDFSYLAGLCHSLGVLALACCYPERTSALLKQHNQEDDVEFEHLCRDQFGFSVDDLTYEIAVHWDMPSLIVEGYRHRANHEAKDNLLAAILNASVHAAKYVQHREDVSEDELAQQPAFQEELPYVEASTLASAALGSNRDRQATQSRLLVMVG